MTTEVAADIDDSIKRKRVRVSLKNEMIFADIASLCVYYGDTGASGARPGLMSINWCRCVESRFKTHTVPLGDGCADVV